MLEITVTGAVPKRADEFWTHIEPFIGAMVGETGGRLTRISRPDGRCDYRDYGVYELTYVAKWSEHYVRLTVKE